MVRKVSKSTCTYFWDGHVPDTVICWANVGILLAVLLTQRWQILLVQHHFAHRADNFADGWFNIGPLSLAQQVWHMPTLFQPFSFKYYVGTTLVRHGLRVLTISNSLDKFDFPSFISTANFQGILSKCCCVFLPPFHFTFETLC